MPLKDRVLAVLEENKGKSVSGRLHNLCGDQQGLLSDR